MYNAKRFGLITVIRYCFIIRRKRQQRETMYFLLQHKYNLFMKECTLQRKERWMLLH